MASEDGLTAEQQRVKDAYTENRYWTGNFEDILRLEPAWLEAYGELTRHAWERAGLAPKEREFVHVAIDASTTHLYNLGTRAHVGKALDEGATVEELTEVLLITSDVGFNGAREGFAVLAEELSDEVVPDPGDEELADEFRETVESWDDELAAILATDAAFFERYLDIASIPWTEGVLEPTLRELIYVAVNAAGTTVYTPGIRTHVRSALDHGASPSEVAGVIEIASILGSHTMIESADIVREEAEKRGVRPEDA
jgi:alkylhydroperoxidase/carboxymuconolactone decarboxylase family protein YurZ